jgi:serine protease Do
MTVATPALSHRLRPLMAAICLSASLGAGLAAAVLTSAPALARGPDGIADVAEKVIDAVVNISTSQTVEAKGGPGGEGRGATPQLPPGSPFEEFFDDFSRTAVAVRAARGAATCSRTRPTRSAPASSSIRRASS